MEVRASNAAYLHGSFGSGKSHFMTVLHALLRGAPAARGGDEFAPLLTKHSTWLDGRRFLLVPYHLTDARSLEQRVLGGYQDAGQRSALQCGGEGPRWERPPRPEQCLEPGWFLLFDVLLWRDRGWHLLAVLERLTRVAGRPVQRIGLSATVGNPDQLLHWLQGSGRGVRPARVVAPDVPTSAVTTAPRLPALAAQPANTAAVSAPPPGDIELDYVGSVDNAARVIAALHRGEKRLVFCDSRALVEELGQKLRALGATTFLSHASLSVHERRCAEEAFAEQRDCVIVATSTLELGIDVGDRTDPALLTQKVQGPRLLLLGGRSWRVTHIDWTRRRCFVEPADGGGKARWLTGAGAIRSVVSDGSGHAGGAARR